MYRSYYSLAKKPFQLNTDPAFFWLGEKHKEALTTLKHGVTGQKGFSLVSGDVGTGKTTLINALLESLEKDTLVANITDPALDLLEFLNFIALSFNIPKKFDDKTDFIVYFNQFLKKAYSENRNVLLIIDEVHGLSKEALEQIRLLSNIELPEVKLPSIFLVGQNEIHQTLALPECRAIRQRIDLVYQIEPLLENETMAYIKHRLQIAGTEKTIFTQNAIQEIHYFSNGYPRLINAICDHALVTGYARDKKKITPKIINECAQQFAFISETLDKNHSISIQKHISPIKEIHNNATDVSKISIVTLLKERRFFRISAAFLAVLFRKGLYFRTSTVVLALMILVITGFYQKVVTSIPPTKAFEADPQNAEAYFDLGRLYTKEKKYQKAINAYQKAIALRHRPSDTFYNLGFIYASIDDFTNAEKMLLHVVELRPSYLDKVLFNLAVVQQKQGKKQQCIENLEKAISNNPMNQRVRPLLSG